MDPFEFHTGIKYKEAGDQFYGTCPFCEKDGKFYFNKEFLWDCKNARCVDTRTGKRRSGNVYTFLFQLYEELDTRTKAMEDLYHFRGIPKIATRKAGVKYNPYNNSYIIPTFRGTKITNLYKAVRIDEKFRVLATPGIGHSLMNIPEDPHETIWIVEGHWDRIVAEFVFSGVPDVTVLGVPGAGVWNRSWTDLLADREVIFCYDNDEAGKTGYERVITKMIAEASHKPKSIKYVEWPKEYGEGFDLSDLFKEHKSKTYEVLKGFVKEFEAPEHLVVVKQTIETVQPNKDIDTFEKLLDVFSQHYYLTEDMELLLLMCLISIYSINVGGEQIWVRVIGPPGCGKTTISKVLAASEQVVLKSTFTGLFSGWIDDKGEDASLVPLIAGKTLIIKDADALLQQPNISKIFSELRDFYDKDSSTFYKNRVAHDYRNIPTTIILCGTNALRKADQSYLGERFLDIELTLSKEEEKKIEEKTAEKAIALALEPSSLPPETPVQAAAKGFILHLMERKIKASLSAEEIEEITKLAKFAARMRTKVDRDSYGKGDPTFSPVTEVGTRLIGQLIKTAMCVQVVAGDKADYYKPKLIRKLVESIIDLTSNRCKICMDLMEGWFSRDELIESTGLPKNQVNRELDNLRLLGLVDEKKIPSAIPRYKKRVFTLKDEIKIAFQLLFKE